MDSKDNYLDIDELAKRIEERIKELEHKDDKTKNESSHKKDERISDLDKIIADIDKRIQELDEESKNSLDVDMLMDKINKKLAKDEKSFDDNETYDLSEITKAINETIRALEEKRKKKKQDKARYCDMARRNAYEARNK